MADRNSVFKAAAWGPTLRTMSVYKSLGRELLCSDYSFIKLTSHNYKLVKLETVAWMCHFKMSLFSHFYWERQRKSATRNFGIWNRGVDWKNLYALCVTGEFVGGARASFTACNTVTGVTVRFRNTTSSLTECIYSTIKDIILPLLVVCCQDFQLFKAN